MSLCSKVGLSFSVALVLLGLAGPATAQDPPVGVAQVGLFDGANNYADVWAEGDVAYIGRFGSNKVDIVSIANPAAPSLMAVYDTGVGGASAQDVKSANGLLFVGLEGVNPGAQIVDVRDPFNPVLLTNITVRSGVHNAFFDDGWLYLVDSSRNEVSIVDLRSYDPDNPPAVISSSDWEINNVGSTFVHDITVQDGRLYASAWDSLRIYDVSDLANTAPTQIGSASGNSVHAAWATDDGRWVVVAEERTGGGLTLFEIIPDGNDLDLVARDTFTVDAGQAVSTHNPLIVGERVYVSWYEAGMQVFDIDPDAATLTFVASFDTTALHGGNSFFGGCWGVYPFLGPDRVLAIDQQNGMFVLDVDPNLLKFSYPNGKPNTTQPDVMTPVEVQVSAIGAPVDGATVFLDSRIDGADQPSVAMSSLGGELFGGDLPAAACGSEIEFAVRASNTNGDAFRDPADLATWHQVDVASSVVTVFDDDFEVDQGWTVENLSLSRGAWERGDPIGTGPQPEDCFADGGGDQCYFTGQGQPGGGVSEQDVDGGPTRLISPAIDFSLGDGVIRYSWWLSNDDGDDSLVVELSDDDGNSWVEARDYLGGNGGWLEDSIKVGDFVTPTATVRIRFSVADNPNDSVTEAAIDYVRAEVFVCDPAPGGLDLTVGPIVRGQTATLTAEGAERNENIRFAMSLSGLGEGRCPPPLGGLCFDILGLKLVGAARADSQGVATVEIAIPGNLPGDTIWYQAVAPRGVDSIKSNVVEKPIEDAP